MKIPVSAREQFCDDVLDERCNGCGKFWDDAADSHAVWCEWHGKEYPAEVDCSIAGLRALLKARLASFQRAELKAANKPVNAESDVDTVCRQLVNRRPS